MHLFNSYSTNSIFLKISHDWQQRKFVRYNIQRALANPCRLRCAQAHDAKTDLQKHVTVSSTSMEREVSMAEYLSTFLLPRPNIEPITLNTSRERHNTLTALSQRIRKTGQRNDWNEGIETEERYKIEPEPEYTN